MNNRRVIERKNQQQKLGLRPKRFQVVAGAKPGMVSRVAVLEANGPILH